MPVLVGVGAAALTAATVVLTHHAAAPGSEGRAFGASLGAQTLGWGIGPLAGAAVVAVAGLPAVFLVSAVASAALLVPLAVAPAWFPAIAARRPRTSEAGDP